MKRLLLIITCALVFGAPPSPARKGEPAALYPVVRGGKWGFIDEHGQVVVGFRYERAEAFSEGLAAVRPGGESGLREGYIDASGKTVIGPKFDVAHEFSEGLAAVYSYTSDACGYIDKAGEVVIPVQFERARRFSEGLAAVRVKGLYGYVDRAGKLRVAPQFVRAGEFYGGLAAVSVWRGDTLKTGYINQSGEWAIQPEFTLGNDFSEGLAVVGVGGTAHPHHEGLMLQHVRFNIIDRSGKVLLKDSFDGANGSFSEGLLPVRVGDIWGYVDRGGQFVIRPQFNDAAPFSEGLGAVRLGSSLCFIDKTGKILFSTRSLSLTEFKRGLALVEVREDRATPTFGYINKKGVMVWAPTR